MRIPTWFVMAWVMVIVLVGVGGSILAYMFVRDRAAELDAVLELPDPPQMGRPVVDAGPSGDTAVLPDATPTEIAVTPADSAAGDNADAPPPDTPGDTVSPVDSTELEPDVPTYQPLQDPRRVNVLLLGIDQREGESGPFPTDTIILFSLDPVGKTGAILSIPRDLWIEMPGLNRSARINSANITGEDISYPGGGGPAFAARAVEKILGVDEIDYYVLINFEVFFTVIDAIGPIEVCPPEEIHDDKYPDGSYGYITVHFDAGCQELDSERLLQYARTRHSDSDIGRSTRQQEVILSVRQKVLSAGGVMSLIPEITSIWQSMQDNIHTNITFEELVSLALTAETVPSDNIRQGQITFEEVFLGTADDGSEILIPISSDIQALVSDLFRPAGAPSTRTPSGEGQ